MPDKEYQWSAIAKDSRFVEHCQKKNRFLVLWWGLGSLVYFLLLIGAGYATELFKVKVIGRINVGYLLFVFNFISTWAIAIYYYYKADREFDPNTRELLSELDKGGRQ
jgi:uncharacterized membrane protein (DUF485 family)